MNKEEFEEAFDGIGIKPVSDTVWVGARQMHCISTPKSKDSVLIFVHGSPGSWSAFIDYIKNEKLTNAFDIISVDRAGYGASGYGIPEPSLSEQARLINDALNLSYNYKIWIGHSLGGPVVARMAMDFPDQVNGLILLAPSIDPDMEKYEWYRTWFKTKIIGSIMPTDFWVSNEEIMPLKSELQLMIPYWSEINVKTLVVHGTKDQFVPVENAYFAQRMMSDSILSLKIIEGANHFIPWSHQELIVDQILSFK